MVFSSLIFLYAFLPLSLAVYTLCRSLRAKNISLLVFSLIFYAWGEPVYVLLLMAMALFDWYFALRVQRAQREEKNAKLWVALACVVNLGLIGFFKYAGMVCSIFGDVPAFVQRIALPLGISFYTFQLLSYVVDVYRGDAEAQDKYWHVLLYAALFHQCIAGPIVRYKDVNDQLISRRETPTLFNSGVRLFMVGMAKKVLLANQFGMLWDTMSADPVAAGMLGAWAGACAYTLQIYFDFAGYSDMARGLGRMLGFEFMRNFNYPYISASITEFWRRWHMTLSGWFREYVYIPLGGNRKGLKRQILNLFIVELLTGIWHGANWNFICWGLYYFVLLAVEKLFLLPYLKKGRVWPHFYTLFLVVVGWTMFVGNDTGVSFGLLFQKLFIPSGGVSPLYFLRNYGVLLAVSVVCCTPLIEKLWDVLRKNVVTRCAAILTLLVVSTAYVVGSTNSPFLYFNF